MQHNHEFGVLQIDPQNHFLMDFVGFATFSQDIPYLSLSLFILRRRGGRQHYEDEDTIGK